MKHNICMSTSVLAATLFLGAAVALAGVDPATKCESTKIKSAGKYGGCLLKAESKALLKGSPSDTTKCTAKLAKIWAKAEAKAAGQCPTNGDVDLVDGYVTTCRSSAELSQVGSIPKRHSLPSLAAMPRPSNYLDADVQASAS